ncbi:hypothetical protein Q757_02730 [Oenococcus alcoholitolerans]|uniref:Uncharacterized protein n=1 Tax=Oenococcus alcoholitolerans TaxID=931074 RepID=A0ABR4XST3_9LACO|nr:hypothetical protein Q757_02730 [Oenococcus alcoholitolerans]
MCWLGVGDPDHDLHSDGLNPDEAALARDFMRSDHF